MFDVGPGELLVLVLAALFILGPERLPGAAAWAGQAIRRVKQAAATAQEQVRSECGPEFGAGLDALREPFAELKDLAGPLRTVRSLGSPGGAARAVVSLTKKSL